MQLNFVGGDKAKIQQVRNISIYDFYQFMAKEREQRRVIDKTKTTNVFICF